MTNEKIEVSIVIPTYNGGSKLENCLRMIFKQKFTLPYEVIVIDSGSVDNTLKILQGFPVRVERINRQEFNHGLTRNMGVDLARGKYVVLLTQDAIPADDDWLENMLTNFKDELVAGVYCRQIPREDADVLTKRHLNHWITNRQERVVNVIEKEEDYHALKPMERLIACTFDNVCSCLRKSVWQQIPFTNAYITEDIEWGKKAIQAGHIIVYEPQAAVIHSHSRSFIYEYKRTYLVHRRLYKLFDLQTVPTFKLALIFSFSNSVKDPLYVLKHELSWKRKLSLILRIPFLSFASVFGQYLGARDEALGRKLKKFRDV